jgi:hypothetical protein
MFCIFFAVAPSETPVRFNLRFQRAKMNEIQTIKVIQLECPAGNNQSCNCHAIARPQPNSEKQKVRGSEAAIAERRVCLKKLEFTGLSIQSPSMVNAAAD